MRSITFKTRSGNNYLYSPNRKRTIPIPTSLLSEIMGNGKGVHSQLYTSLRERGYMDEWHQNLSGRITAENVEQALNKLPQVVFETTTACNLKCEYCCYGDGYATFENRKSGKLDFSTAKSVIDFICDRFSKESVTSICKQPFAISFYGGEPLMNFHVIKDIVEYAESCYFKNRELRFTMTTNALLLAKYADFLNRHKFRILVSLDGNKVHDAYRKTVSGKESFNIVFKNLKSIQNNYPDLFSNIRFNAVYTDKSDAGEILDFFHSEFNKFPQFSILHDTDGEARDSEKIRNMYKPLSIPEPYRLNSNLLLENPIHKHIIELCIKSSEYCYYDEGELMEDSSLNVKYPSGTCVPFSKRLFVSTDGKFLPCEKINRDVPLGNASKNGVINIDTEHIANRFNKMLAEQEKLCLKCYLQPFCTKCALQYSSSLCKNIITEKQLAKMLTEVYSYIEENPYIIDLLERNIVIR
jgi:uncharacterized protein